MAAVFPVGSTIKQSVLGVFSFMPGLLAMFALYVAIYGLGYFTFAAIWGEVTAWNAAFVSPPDPLLPYGNWGRGLQYLLPWALLFFLGTWLTNSWIRFVVLGRDQVLFERRRVDVWAALVNTIKFILIMLLAFVFGLVALLILAVLGVISLQILLTFDSGWLWDEGSTALALGHWLGQAIEAVVTTGLIALVFAHFADTVTWTALGRRVEGIGPNYTFQFTKVLLVIMLAPELIHFLIELLSYPLANGVGLFADIVGGAATSAAYGYRQVWRLRAYLGDEQTDALPEDTGAARA